MSKQTAVEFLIQQIELALKLNKVQINFEYRIKTINPVYEIAKKMEREQIENAWHAGVSDSDDTKSYYNARYRATSEKYYNKTYKGGEQ